MKYLEASELEVNPQLFLESGNWLNLVYVHICLYTYKLLVKNL